MSHPPHNHFNSSFFFAIPSLFPAKRRQSQFWMTSAACLTTWQTNWMQCWTDLLPMSHFQQALFPLSPIMCRCIMKHSQGLMLALWECVRACVFQHLSLLRECFSCSLDQCTEEGVLFIWCGSSSNTFPVRGGRSHTTSDLCSPASHRRPAFRDGCVCVHREAQSCSSSFYLYRLWLGQRS